MGENVVVENETTEILATPEAVIEPTNTDPIEVVKPTDGTPTDPDPKTEDLVAKPDQPVVKNKPLDVRLAQIKRATWEKHQAAERQEAANKRAEELQKNQLQPPNLDDFATDAEYQTANQAYIDRQVEARTQAQLPQSIQRQQAEREKSDKDAQWQYDCEKETEKNAAFPVNVANVERTLMHYKAGAMADAITTSDKNTLIVNHLAAHPEELERIATLSPLQQVMEVGVIQAKLSHTPVKKITKAPEPVTPASGGSAPKNMATMSQAEYNKYRNEQEMGIR